MKGKTVVIIGAGVAGLSCAWWLSELGCKVTVIERAPDLRSSGYMLGLSGPGFQAIEKLGLLELLKKYQPKIESNVYYNAKGDQLFNLIIKKIWGTLDILMIPRTDLVKELYQLVAKKTSTQVLFSTQLKGFKQCNASVTLELSDGSEISTSMLIGADGVRSKTRQLLFDCEMQCQEPLGYKVAAFSLNEGLHPQTNFQSYAEPNRISEFYPLQGNRASGMYLWKDNSSHHLADRESALSELADQFAHSHPKVKQRIAAIDDEEPLLFDSLIMIDLPKWSQGRVLLLGDAAHCLTLLSGQGAGMAMTSAYVLTQSLARLEFSQALQDHERQMRPVITRLQQRSRKLAPWIIPSSEFNFKLRNLIIKCLPNKVIGWFFLRAVKSDIIAAEFEQP